MSAPANDCAAADRLQRAIEVATPQLLAMSSDASARPTEPGKWTPREIIGHLVDSAMVNHQRFVRAADQVDLVFPGYPQDTWVTRQHYADVDWEELITLWRALNAHVARLMRRTPREQRVQLHERHSLDRIAFRVVPATMPTSLEYLMTDYVDHLEHHLRQILGADWRADAA